MIPLMLREHIIADFQVPYKYGLEIFIATIESVIVTWLESGAKEEPIEIATIILSISDFTELELSLLNLPHHVLSPKVRVIVSNF